MKKKNPRVIGRFGDNDLDERAETYEVCNIDIPHPNQKVVITAFRSHDIEDRGGIIFRITNEESCSFFHPHAVNIKGGIEIHMAGDIEADNFLGALSALLREMRL